MYIAEKGIIFAMSQKQGFLRKSCRAKISVHKLMLKVNLAITEGIHDYFCKVKSSVADPDPVNRIRIREKTRSGTGSSIYKNTPVILIFPIYKIV